jgi:hypothetical protein
MRFIYNFSRWDRRTVMIYEEVSVEEMWKVIESFGIDRKMLERTNPDNQKIKDLYQSIKSK